MALRDFVQKMMLEASPKITANTVKRGYDNVVGFYGPFANAGTTNMCVNVAKRLHSSKNPVVILDFSLNCPTVFRYFMDEVPPEASFMGKIRNPATGIREYLVRDNDSGICICTLPVESTPMDYCDMGMDAVTAIISELKDLFAYVIIDLGQDLNYETTIRGLQLSENVYTCVRPIAGQIEKLSIFNEIVGKTGYLRKLSRVIQTNVCNDSFSKDELKEMDLIDFGSVEYSEEIRQFADNYEFLKSPQSPSARRYSQLIDRIVKEIGGEGNA